MLRKLILAAAAVVALSAGAQAQNTITTTQTGGVNDSNTVQFGVVNEATLTQSGFFNNASAGQTGTTSNTSTITQQGFPGFEDGAARNTAAVGQNILNTGTNGAGASNTSEVTQTSSADVAAMFGATVTNAANITQLSPMLSMNSSTVQQTQNP